MKDCAALLKEKQIRLTPQRLVVYAVLAASKLHLTAEQIYGKVKQKIPAISFATVYAILEHYGKKGLVRENRISFNKSCFETRTDWHHHFYCKKCKSVFDIDMRFCPALEKEEIEGHMIEDLQGNFYGLCRNCRKK